MAELSASTAPDEVIEHRQAGRDVRLASCGELDAHTCLRPGHTR